MALPEDFYTNKYLNPSAFNSNTASPMTFADGKGINDDFRKLLAADGGIIGTAPTVVNNIMLWGDTAAATAVDSGINITDLINEIFYGALQVDAATTAVLAGSPTYNNGVSGVGATLTKGSNGAFPSQDGVTSVVNMRVLVKNQASALQNGVYELTTLGTAGTPWVLTRTTDSDLSTQLDAQVIIVGAGTVNVRRIYSQTTPLPTIGTSSIVYSQTAAAAGIGAPLSRTVAQMQALVAASGITPGRAYIISNVQSADCTCSALFIGLTTTTISGTGWGLFDNAGMTTPTNVTIEYNLTTDLISSIYVKERNVLVKMRNNCVTLVTNWPFDSATITDGVANDPTTTPNTAANVSRFYFAPESSPNLGAGTTFRGVIEAGASATLGGTSTSLDSYIGENSQFSLAGTQNVTIRITAGQVVDMNGYLDSAYNPGYNLIVDGVDSNVIIQDTDLVTPGTLNMASNSGVIDMSGLNFIGTFIVRGDATQKLEEFANMPLYRKWKVVPDIDDADDVLINSKPNGSTNIYLETNTFITLVGSANPVDYCEFMVDTQDPTKVIKVGGANYTR